MNPDALPHNAIRWSADPRNPRNWSGARKAYCTVVVSGVGFVSTMAASIYSPGHELVSAEVRVSQTVALLPLALYNLGMGFGPILSSPLSETFGRKAVYMSTIPLFAIFTLGSGLSHTIAALITCRFFAGAFAAPGVSIASATIADIVAPSQRAVPLAVYYTFPFIGSLFGVLIGGYVVDHKGWRWTQWTILLFNAVCFISVLFLQESYKKTILQNLDRKDRIQTIHTSSADFNQTFKYFVTKTVIRPINMLFTEPIVALVCIYSSFQFALLYAFVVASPNIFLEVYRFSIGAQGLTFLGFIVGCSVACVTIILIDCLHYQPKLRRVEADIDGDSGHLAPECRLYCSMIGSLVLPTGLFWFAWTAKGSVPWICPILAQGCAILGSVLVYVGANLYMVEVYGPLYGASAAGATSLSRYSLATAFPLFSLQMYNRLGIGWATSLLGFCTIAMAPIPWVFYRWGPRLRARSGYEHED